MDHLAVDRVFEALANDKRRRLLAEMVAQRAATAAELCEIAGMSRQGVSKHLSDLEGAGLITRKRWGRCVFYKIEAAGLFGALGWIAEIGSAEAQAQQRGQKRKVAHGFEI